MENLELTQEELELIKANRIEQENKKIELNNIRQKRIEQANTELIAKHARMDDIEKAKRQYAYECMRKIEKKFGPNKFKLVLNHKIQLVKARYLDPETNEPTRVADKELLCYSPEILSAEVGTAYIKINETYLEVFGPQCSSFRKLKNPLTAAQKIQDYFTKLKADKARKLKKETLQTKAFNFLQNKFPQAHVEAQVKEKYNKWTREFENLFRIDITFKNSLKMLLSYYEDSEKNLKFRIESLDTGKVDPVTLGEALTTIEGAKHA